MKVFISWSGRRSREVAVELHFWIREILQAADTWMSTDIPAGARWGDEIGRRLAETSFGIVCLTPENDEKPWLLFEAGALAKALDRAVVCPYVIGGDDEQPLPEPLRQFQVMKADRDGTLGLFRAINARLQQPLEADRLDRAFGRCWPELQKSLDNIAHSEAEPRRELPFGLESVHLNRGTALAEFRRYVDDELCRAATNSDAVRLWVVGSSLLGLLEFDSGTNGGWLQRAQNTGGSVRILMTDPTFAGLREAAEVRPEGSISREIEATLTKLRQLGFDREQVHFYKGTPTAFAIATSNRMLINPYPYGASAYQCFCLIVASTSAQPTETPTDIFSQYLNAHFVKPWMTSEAVPLELWEASQAPEPPDLDVEVERATARLHVKKEQNERRAGDRRKADRRGGAEERPRRGKSGRVPGPQS
jgi:TIR domain